MHGITVLIFNIGRPHNLLDLVKDMYVFDEIVIIDSSYTRQKEQIKEMINSMQKVKYYHVPPLGYPDPFRKYALSKCSNEWILYIDTDERIDNNTKWIIKRLINTSLDSFMINRINYIGEKLKNKNDYQIRLFRKDKIEYEGYAHETGKVNKINMGYLPEECALVHSKDGNEFGLKKLARKHKNIITIETYTRPDLFTINTKRMLGEIIRQVKKGEIPKMYLTDYLKECYEEMLKLDREERELRKRIAEKVKKMGGVINYLGLDREFKVLALEERFKDTELTGIEIFKILMRENL